MLIVFVKLVKIKTNGRPDAQKHDVYWCIYFSGLSALCLRVIGLSSSIICKRNSSSFQSLGKERRNCVSNSWITASTHAAPRDLDTFKQVHTITRSLIKPDTLVSLTDLSRDNYTIIDVVLLDVCPAVQFSAFNDNFV